jgi:hypothetical protein
MPTNPTHEPPIDSRQRDDVVTQGPPEHAGLEGKNSDDRTRQAVPPETGAPSSKVPGLANVTQKKPDQTDTSGDLDRRGN